MKDKCQICRDKPREKGRFYITTSLVSTTTRLDALHLCKECSDQISTEIWYLVHRLLREDIKGEDYWFSAKNCFSCNDGALKRETRETARVLVCSSCGAVNASINTKG